jgi:hypothetical protein
VNDRPLDRDEAAARDDAPGSRSAEAGAQPVPRPDRLRRADREAHPRRGPTDEVITMIWRRAALLAVVLLVLTIALVVALKLSHTATGPPPSTSTTH